MSQAAHPIRSGSDAFAEEIAFLIAGAVVVAIPIKQVIARRKLRLCNEIPDAIASGVLNDESHVAGGIE